MDVSWVSWLIIFYSCGAAIDIKKENSSMIDDFHLLDNLIQQEICKMLKQTNTSSRFNLDGKTEGIDLCNNLELSDIEEIEHKSLMGKLDRIPLIEFNSSSVDNRRTKINTFLPDLLPNGKSKTSGKSTISDNPLVSSHSTIQNIPSFFGAHTPKVKITSWTSEDSTISSDLRDQSSPEPSSMLNMAELIINSNTPMRPDPTYSDEESNISNSLESSASVSNVSMFTNNPLDLSASYRSSIKKDAISKPCTVCFPGKCRSSSISKPGYRSTSDFGNKNNSKLYTENSTVSNAAVRTSRNFEKINGEFHVLPEKRKSTSLNSNTSKGQSSSTRIPDRCLKCITTTSPSTTSDDFFNNLICLKYCATKPSTYISNLSSSSTSFIKLNTTDHSTRKSSNCSNPFEPIFRSTLFSKSNNSQDFTSRSSKLSYSSKATSTPTSLTISHMFIQRSSSSPHSSKLPSSSTPSSKFQTFYNSRSRSPSFSDKSNASSAKPYPLEDIWFPSSTHSSIKPSYQHIPRTSTTSKSQPLVTPVTESTTHFCGLSTIKPYQSINTTTVPKYTPKPWCDAVKLTVNPKSPRATRRNTKIYSSVGNLHSYAGFFKTDQQDNVRLFFWFFCNPKWRNTPLIVWLQGEPGQSSLHGLFQEHGPYYMEHTINGVDIKLRKFSWTKEYNVLYLDSCIGCGFSTADHEEAHPSSYDNVSRHVYEALKQFFKVWHEMQSNDLYLAGSYGSAKYIPVIAHKIHNANSIVGFCGRRMNLKGMLIGGPYVNSATMVNYNDFLLANGIIDEITHKDMIPLQYQAQQLIRSGKYQDAIDFLNIHIYCIISQAGYDDYEDVRILRKLQCDNLRNIFRSKQFKKMICIDELNFDSKSELLIEEIMPPVDTLMPDLLSHYKVLYYNGQFDLMAPYMLAAKSLLELEWESINQFYTTEMIQWCPFSYQNGTSCPAGFYKSYQNLTHVMVRNAGHSVGVTHSKSLFYLLKWFVEDKFQRYQDNGNWYE